MGQFYIILFSVTIFILNFLSGYIVSKQKPLDRPRRIFLFINIAIAVWIIFNVLTTLAIYFPSYALTFDRLSLLGPAFIPSLILLFVYYFSDRNYKLTPLTAVAVLLPGVFFVALLPTKYNIESVSIVNNVVIENIGILYPLYAVYSVLFLLLAFRCLYATYHSQRGNLRSQISYVFTGLSISLILGVVINVVLPAIGIKYVASLGPTSVVIFIALTAYAIIAHQLFDIRVIIKRTVVYSGLLVFTLVTYSLVIFLFTAAFGGERALDPKTFIANLIAAMLIAFGFEPIRRYLTKVTDKYLFKGEYNPQDVLSELSAKLSNSLDIREATQALVSLIKKEMRLSRAAVITFAIDEGKTIIREATQDGYPDPAILQLPPENLFLQQFAHSPQIVVTELLRRECENRNPTDPTTQACKILLVDLDKLGISSAFPILVDQKPIGIFMVGEKLSGDAFSQQEMEFLSIVANQTANAIQKTRYWEEDQMKSEFVSVASHELLTPTAAIKGYLSMILEDNMGQIDPVARGFLVKVYNSTDRLAHLVEDLLNVSRIESGRLKVNKREFSLTESVGKAAEELAVNAKAKSLDLAYVPPAQELGNVYADPDHVYRVLVNLIGNAIKYTPAGWVRCFVTQYDAEHLLFSVSDSGLGIPKDSIPHLFEKFYRADRKEISGIQGTGLGLYISRKIIDLMGGKLWLESEVGKGTTFYFTLPLATAVAPAVAQAETAAVTQPAPAAAVPATAPPTAAPAPQTAPSAAEPR